MPNDIEVTLKVKDELTKGMKKVNDVMGEMGDVSEEAIAKSMKLGKQMEDIGVSADEMTDDFLALNPQLKLYKELSDSGAQSTKELAKEQKEAEKKSKKMAKGLGGIVKGFVGVGTAVAAGRALQQFAKDSLAAAGAAGTLPPAFKEAEEASDRLKVAAGTRLGTALEKPVDVLNRMKDSTAANLEVQNRLIEAERLGLITAQERSMFIVELNKGMRSQVDVVGELVEIENKHNDVLKEGRELRGGRGGPRGQLSEEMLRRRRISGRGEATGGEAGRGLDVNVGFGGMIGGALDQLSLFKQGQLELEESTNKLLEDYQKGTKELGIWAPTVQRVEQELQKAAVAQAQMALEAGRFGTEAEIAAQLADQLSVGPREALNLLRGVNTELDKMNGRVVRMGIIVDVRGGGAGFLLPGGLGGGAGVATGASGKVIEANALGGGITAGRTSLVGERGPELFTPGTSGTITPNDQLGGSNAALEASMDGMRADLKNGFLDLGQTIVEAMG